MRHKDVESAELVDSPQSGNGKSAHPDLASLRRLIEMLPQIAFVGTSDASHVYFNQYWYAYAGIAHTAEGVDAWTPAVHPDDLQRGLAAWQQAIETGREHSGEYRLRRAADGQYRWHQVHSVPVKDLAGSVTVWMSTMLDVHQQKFAEEELRASEARLRAILDAEPECVKTLSPQGLVREINPAGLAMMEADSAEQVVGQPIFHLVCEPYREQMIQLNKDVMAGETRQLDFEMIGFKGTRRHLRTYATPLRDLSGKVVSMLSISQDVTQQKKAESALRENEARFRALIEDSTDAIAVCDANLTPIYASPAAMRMVGYEFNEVGNLPDLCHPGDLETLTKILSDCLSNPGKRVPGVIRARHKKSGWRVLEGTLTNLLHDESVRGLILNCRDITDKVHAQEALRRSEAKFRALIEKSSDAITLLDAALNAIYSSPAADRILGYGAGEIANSRELIHPQDEAVLQDALRKCLSQPGASAAGVVRARHKNGEWRVLEGTLTNLLHDPDVGGIVANTRDITDKVRGEAALHAREAKFRALIEHSTSVVLLFDATGNVIYTSMPRNPILGYSADEAAKLQIRDVCHPDDRSLLREASAVCMASPGVPMPIVLRLKSKSGAWRTLDFTLTNWLHNPDIAAIVGNYSDITDRTQAEEALRLTRFSVERAAESIFWVGPDAKILDVNEAACRSLGYSRAELLTKTVHDIDPTFPKEVWPAHWQELKEKGSFTFETSHVAKDGSILTTETSVNYLEFGGKEYNCAFMRDVSDRKRAEAALQASEAKFRTLIENSTSVIALYDKDWSVIYTSIPKSPILGYDPEEKRELKLPEICHPDDRQALQAAAKTCFKNPGMPVNAKLRFRRKDGVWRMLDLTLTNWLQNSSIRAFVGNYSDITERTHAEAALRASEAKFRALIENSTDAVVLLDRDLHIQYSSPATSRILQYDPGTFTGVSLLDFCHPDDLAVLREKFAASLAQPGNGVHGSVRIRHRNGQWRILEGTLTNLLEDPDVRAIVNNYRDITEKVEQQEALRLSEDKFKRVFENSPDAITLSRLENGVFLEVNGAFEELCGYDREEIIGHTGLELRLREKPEQRQEIIDSVKEKGRVARLEFRLRRKSGELVPVQFSADIIDVHGTPCLLSISRDISARYEVEQALRASENKFKSAFQNSPDAITISSLEDGRFLEVNEAFERLSGYTASEARGRSGIELGIWLSQEQRGRVARVLRETGRITGEELFLRRKDGVVCPAQFSAELIEIRGTMCMLTVTRDITERKLAEEALRASEERFKKAFGFSPDALTITTLVEGRYLEINEAFERLSGYSREDVIGNTAIRRGIWADSRERDHVLRELHAGRPVHGIETTFRRKDGSTFPAQFSAEIIEMGGVKCMLAISRDITDLKRAEKELRRSEEQHRSSIEHAPYGICRTIIGGSILMVNSSMVRMLGYETAEEVLALDLTKDVYANPEDRTRLLTMIRSGVPPEWPLATTLKRKDGSTISVHLAGRVIADEQGRPYEFETFVEDVTQKETLETQLRIVQKMEAVGQLAGGVAHDFNNLLMIMGSRAEMILEHLTETQRVAAQAEEIVRATRRGAALTGQLLAFSRKQVLQSAVLNLNEVLLNMNKILPRLIREDVETSVVTSNQIGNVRVDRDQFEQVVMNLAINARDAMPHGGKFRIETSPAEVTEEFAAAHPEVKAGRYVLVTVQDSGVGMDAQTQSRIFEPFFTTKERGRGTGLGLAMVYGMVKQSGGYIEVHSAPGQGTTFSLYFPAVSEAHNKLGKEETLQSPTGAETILLVEDEAALRTVCAVFLRDRGYKVLEAGNGVEALDIYRRQTGEIDVLVTDVIMPRMTGLDLYQHAKALRPDLRAVFISGYSDAVIDYQTLPGENAYLQKPFSMARLAGQVRAALDRKS